MIMIASNKIQNAVKNVVLSVLAGDHLYKGLNELWLINWGAYFRWSSPQYRHMRNDEPLGRRTPLYSAGGNITRKILG